MNYVENSDNSLVWSFSLPHAAQLQCGCRFLSTESEQLIWKAEGLPSDELSMENAVVILQVKHSLLYSIIVLRVPDRSKPSVFVSSFMMTSANVVRGPISTVLSLSHLAIYLGHSVVWIVTGDSQRPVNKDLVNYRYCVYLLR